MPILYVKDDIGNFISIPALKGDKGDKGDSGDGSGDMSKATYSPNFDGELSPKSHTHTASVITQDANNRFSTDAEKANWNAKAAIASPTFTGAPKAPTATTGTNTTQIATTQFVQDNVSTGIISNSAALIPTVAGNATTRDLTVPAGSNANRITIIRSVAVTATSAIRLRIGTGSYYPIVISSGASENATELLAGTPYELFFDGANNRWIAPMAYRDVLVNISYSTNTSQLLFRKCGKKVKVLAKLYMNLGQPSQDTTVGTIPIGFRPSATLFVPAMPVTKPLSPDITTPWALLMQNTGEIQIYGTSTDYIANGVPTPIEYFTD